MLSLLRKAFVERQIWHIAYRTVTGEEEKLFATPVAPVYIPLKLGYRYWLADPFLFEYNNVTYIFMERYDYLLGRGVIAYTKYQNGRWSKVRDIIRKNYHMSYPFIFQRDREIFLIPETNRVNRIEMFRAVDFPDKWERKEIVMEQIQAIDTTLFDTVYGSWLFTALKTKGDNQKQLMLYSRIGNESVWQSHPMNPVRRDGGSQPAGRVFRINERIIRPSQFGYRDNYGSALLFNEIIALSPETYEERTLKRITPADFSVARGPRPFGIHTYSANRHWEVIDYKITRFNPLKPLLHIAKLMCALFSKGKADGENIYL